MRMLISLAALAALTGTLVALSAFGGAQADHRSSETPSPTPSTASAATGQPILISNGMSSTKVIWTGSRRGNPDYGLGFMNRLTGNENVVVLNGARGSTDIDDWANNRDSYGRGLAWTEWIVEQVTGAGYAVEDVRYIWMLHADRDCGSSVVCIVEDYLANIDWAQTVFPNLETIYLSDMYVSGDGDDFWPTVQAARQVIAMNLPGVVAGPQFWEVDNPDNCSDWYASDDRHPGPCMTTLYGGLLYDFFAAQPWFLGDPGPPTPTATPTSSPTPTATATPSPTSTAPPPPTLLACERVATYSDGSEVRESLPLTEC